ncbi:unnamed protein product [Larinioides sclopetarius]|uniref:Decapping nuclease n=1 Tax=Larinioides sclopetarius TaxID=280406 RepID=A0AAV2A513_9ARAC
MTLHVKRAEYYDGRFPPFRKPSEIGFFSLDGEREYHDDNRQLKYISLPRNLKNVYMDLNIGYEIAVRKDFDSPSSKPNPSIPVNEKEEYCIVLKGRLNNHTLLYSAEVDGKDTSNNIHADGDPQSTQCYTELKTSRIITAQRQHINFCRFKLLKWWLQSFLVGIPKIICGFRDDQGIVRNLEVFPVAEIPRMAQNQWTPASTLNFCSNFMDYVKMCVKKDDPSIVYKFYWKPGSPVSCEELTSTEYQVLPEWYTSSLRI